MTNPPHCFTETWGSSLMLHFPSSPTPMYQQILCILSQKKKKNLEPVYFSPPSCYHLNPGHHYLFTGLWSQLPDWSPHFPSFCLFQFLKRQYVYMAYTEYKMRSKYPPHPSSSHPVFFPRGKYCFRFLLFLPEITDDTSKESLFVHRENTFFSFPFLDKCSISYTVLYLFVHLKMYLGIYILPHH